MPRILVTIPEKSSQPYRFSLDRRLITLGRASENDIVISCGSVSVHHAELRRIDGGYELRDLGSTNGSKYLGERHDTIPLRSGMTVHVGDVELEFTLSDEELAKLFKEAPSGLADDRIDQAARREAGPASSMTAGKPRAGFGSLFVMAVMAFAAFFAGLAIRHQKDTGNSLIDAMKEKNRVVPEEQKAAPAKQQPSPEVE